MRLSSKILSILLNLLLGSAWALTVVGALHAWIRHMDQGWLYATASGLVWALPGLLGVVLLEYMMRGLEHFETVRRQTRLLEMMLRKLQKDDKS